LKNRVHFKLSREKKEVSKLSKSLVVIELPYRLYINSWRVIVEIRQRQFEMHLKNTGMSFNLIILVIGKIIQKK